MPSINLRGWLLDIYPEVRGVSLWFLEENGTRHHLHQDFPVAFYANGPFPQLRAAWKWLRSQPETLQLARDERRDLFAGTIPVLSVLSQPINTAHLFTRLTRAFPDLNYYDSDLPLWLRYSSRYSVFPLAHCDVQINSQDQVDGIRPLHSPWELDIPLPPIKILSVGPDCDPFHAPPRKVEIQTHRSRFTLDLEPRRPFLIAFAAILKRHDPDLLLTAWGDTWLLPHLLKMSKETGIELPLNRDIEKSITQRDARTYYAYGQVIYRGQQVHLAGRWHIDIHNAVMFHDYGLEGIWELARTTALPVQTVARVSPGTGISAMQIVTALKEGILVPWHKQQAEHQKTALDLIRSDMGGLVFQPTIGMHKNVAEIDFVSMYPSIMERFNISPETVQLGVHDPETGLPKTIDEKGLIPKTLEPLLKKRIALKGELLEMSKWDIRYKTYKAQSAAHKWLLVTCFGYLGYKNARFGRIEAHEAVTAYGREALLRAKEAAEDMGFTVLHMYVDGLWVQKDGFDTSAMFQPLRDEIHNRTHLPVSVDGIHRWICFLPSRRNPRVPVANRYFGIFQSGEIKCRGIELRRHDTPAFIVDTQREALNLFAHVSNGDYLSGCVSQIYELIDRRLHDLRHGCIPLEKLVVR